MAIGRSIPGDRLRQRVSERGKWPTSVISAELTPHIAGGLLRGKIAVLEIRVFGSLEIVHDGARVAVSPSRRIFPDR